MRSPRSHHKSGWIALATILLVSPAPAADPVPYTVTLGQTADPALDQGLRDSSTLIGLREPAPVGSFALVARARADVGRLETALGGFGRYGGHVAIRIAGRALDDPELPAVLDAVPAGKPVEVAITPDPGPVYALRRIMLAGDAPPESRAALGLRSGAPAIAADVLAARDRLLSALLNSGHALAKVDPPDARLDPGDRALDVVFTVHAGPVVALGDITVTGTDRLQESYIRRRLRLATGDRFDPAAIEKARQDLGAVPALAGARITGGETLDARGRLPVQVAVTERKLRAVNFGAAFSTDQGASVTADWTHRDLFGHAETLALSAAVTGSGGSASRGQGYSAGAVLTLPDWRVRGENLTVNLNAVKESLDAYDRRAVLAGVTLSRKITDELTASVGVAGEEAQITQEKVKRNYTLVQLPLGLTLDTTGSLFNPVHGYRAALTVTPTESLRGQMGRGQMGGGGTAFVILQASGSTYVDLAAPGRSVVAVRALVGAVEGGTIFDIPPDQRFYAGGGGTVRGFRFQSIGPKFADRRPVGGTAVDVGSVEFRQRYGESLGGVVFVDAGQVSANGAPFGGRLDVGAGVGARYYTSLGPLRVDIAVPLTKEKKGDAFELYLGIGQSF